MEEYIEKIKRLSDDRLVSLIDNYHKTLDSLTEQNRMAVKAAMVSVAEYTRSEIEKKQVELAIVEKILAERAK